MNEPFWGPINFNNNSNMLSQNHYCTPQAAYAKTPFPVIPHNNESSIYSELIYLLDIIIYKRIFLHSEQ